jgi:hypothetical protein
MTSGIIFITTILAATIMLEILLDRNIVLLRKNPYFKTYQSFEPAALRVRKLAESYVDAFSPKGQIQYHNRLNEFETYMRQGFNHN